MLTPGGQWFDHRTITAFGQRDRLTFDELSGLRPEVDPSGLVGTIQARIRVVERAGIVMPADAAFSYLKGVKCQ